MPAGHFRTLLQYNTWADRLVLAKAAEVPEADYFAKAGGLSFGSLHATLVHVLVAEVVWLARWQGGLPPEPLRDARKASDLARSQIPTFAALRSLWREEESKQAAFAASLTDADIERPISYQTQAGEASRQPLHELIAHLVNHGTQFRAEAAVRLTELGLSPGELDLIVYLRPRLR